MSETARTGGRGGPRTGHGERYDAVVVGAGAAGLNAALVLGRARRRVAVVDAGEPRNAPAAHMHGYLSRDGMPPAALLAVGREEVARYGVDLLDGRVEHIEPVDGPGFVVHLAGGPVLRARRVVVATGLRDGLPELPGLAERWGLDVLHCPYCHGWEVRDRPLGVLGTGPGAVNQALLLRQWSADVVLLAHTLVLTAADRERLAARGVRVVEGRIRRLVADDGRLRGVELVTGQVVPREAVFVLPQLVPRDGLLLGLDCARGEDGWVATDRTGRTSQPGVRAVGNVADPRAQVVIAAGTGAAAAFALDHELAAEDVERDLARHRASGAAVPA
ncbi:NAD(P)/FAD-dependent oxidoreductase [Streptomyces rubellomurinus]|uniref:Thioredoxin reductase n=1 Tax=Streptomyces rubellomurinus (strain ATCC 31215) TaxID=359131 RepID=A0A0F2TEV7_STRR3|nr:NAD(P)/FAD-dependent oxidoreductase [Streptomyces rubellomurinus]KJS60860.1 thioredoxin reductase [Streptomyces rubellomurinus]